MNFGELMKEMKVRHPDMNPDTWHSDIEACGVQPGLVLRETFEKCRRTWKYSRAPRPVEFADIYKSCKPAVTTSKQASDEPPPDAIPEDIERWRTIREELKTNPGWQEWLRHLTLKHADAQSVTLGCPTEYMHGWIEIHHHAELDRLWRRPVVVTHGRNG